MKTNTLGFIGGGRIARIFLQGFKNKSVKFDSVKVFEPNMEALNALQQVYPDAIITESAEFLTTQQVIFIAVHPSEVMEILREISDSVQENAVVVSLAPKITLEKMASVLSIKNLVRMIPNATSFINEGFNPVVFNSGMDRDDVKVLTKLFKSLGKTFETNENKLESYAVVSAMLPTYFWFQWLEIERIAIETGLSVKEARKVVKSTMKRAIKLYYNSGLTPSEAMDLIPVKPIGDSETEITNILDTRIMNLYSKIKP